MYKAKLVITFDGSTFTGKKSDREEYAKKIMSWLKRYCADKSRATLSWSTRRVKLNGRVKHIIDYICTVLIYSKDASTHKKVVKKYEKSVTEITVPATPEHEEMIQRGMLLEIRSKLFYDTYRYRMSFNKSFSRETLAEIEAALTNGLGNDDFEEQFYHLSAHNFVYLKTNEDLMYMRLSLADLVKDITVVILSSELEATN